MRAPTVTEYAEMSWHARQRLTRRLKLAERRRARKREATQAAPYVLAAAQQILDRITPDDPAVVAERREWVSEL